MAETIERDYTLAGEVRDAYAAAAALDRLRREARRRDDDDDETGVGERTRLDDDAGIGF